MRAQNLQRATLKKSLFKISKKKHYSEFGLAETPDDLSAKTPDSVVSCANRIGDSEEGSLLDVNILGNSASSDSVGLSCLIQFSSTSEKPGKSDGSTSHHGSKSLVFLKNVSVEADVVSDLLKQAQAEVLKSSDIEHSSKMVLIALINNNIEDFYSMSKEKNATTKLICAKVVLIFFAILLALIFFAKFGSNSSCRGLLPT